MSEPFFRKVADAPTGGAAAAPSVSEQLLKISELYKAGVLSDAEYAAATKRAHRLFQPPYPRLSTSARRV